MDNYLSVWSNSSQENYFWKGVWSISSSHDSGKCAVPAAPACSDSDMPDLWELRKSDGRDMSGITADLADLAGVSEQSLRGEVSDLAADLAALAESFAKVQVKLERVRERIVALHGYCD